MNDSMTDPAKLIAIMKVMLTELERTLSTAPQSMTEADDPRTLQLQRQVDRLDDALKKRQLADRRRKELDRQNRENNGR